jgi:MFS family permease
MDANAEHGAMPPSGRPATTLFIAVAAGIAIANNYALQPALPAVAQTLHAPLAAMGLIAGCLQFGYMAGILLLAPLGDRIAPARLIGMQFFALGAALLAAALAPSLTALAVACCIVGAFVSCFTLGSTFSVSLTGQMQDVLVREWLALSSKHNAADGRSATRPKGAPRKRRNRVAALDKG